MLLIQGNEQRKDLYVFTVRAVTQTQREKHVPIKRTGPPLCAERDSVLLTRLPGNYDVTAVHDKERHHDRDRHSEIGEERDLCGYHGQF